MKRLFRKLSMFFAFGAMIFGSGLVANEVVSNSNRHNVVARAAENEYYTVTANTTAGAANNFTFTWKDTAYKVSKAPTKEDCSVSIGSIANFELIKLTDTYLQVNIITGAEAKRDVSIILHTDNGDYKLTMSIVSGSYSGNCTVESVTCNHESEGGDTGEDKPVENEYYTVTANETSGAANNFTFTWKDTAYKVSKAPTKEDCSVSIGSIANFELIKLTDTYLQVNIITGAEAKRDVSIILHTDNGDYKLTMSIVSGSYSGNCTVESVTCNHESNEEIIANVVSKIDAIGTVEFTSDCKKLIDEARKAYEELDDALKSSVTNYETLTAAEAEYERLMNEADLDIRPIAIDATKTKVNSAGIHIYLIDKPDLTLNDFTMTIVSFESTQHAGDKDQIMSGVTKVHYIKDQGGWLHGTIKVGLPDGHDQKMVINVTYTIGTTIYTQNVTFVGNAYQANNFPTITNAEAKDLLPSTSGESTSSKYFFNGNVLEVTDETNGTFTFVDLDGNIISVASSSLLDTSYADMTSKLNNNDDIIIYGAISNKDGEVEINNAIIVSINRIAQEETFKLIEDVIIVDTCKDYANASDYRARYNALDESKQAIFNSIVINCKADKTDTSLTGSVSLNDKLSYMEVLNASETTNSEESLLNSFVSSNNISIVLVVGLLGLAAIAGYYFVNKKKYC